MTSQRSGSQTSQGRSVGHALSRIVQRLRWRRVQRRRAAFLRRYQPGIYVIASPHIANQIIRQAEAAGFFLAQIDGRIADTRTELLDETARLLHFPDYFGRNWDALDECIQDLEWLPAPGYVIAWDHFERFAESHPEEWKIMLGILEGAVEHWRQTATPMFVFLRGPKTTTDIRGSLR